MRRSNDSAAVVVYFARLAYPSRRDEKHRARFAKCLWAWFAGESSGIRARDIEQVLRRGFQRVERHLWAAHIVNMKILGLREGTVAETARHLASIKQVAAHFSEDVQPHVTSWMYGKNFKLLAMRPAHPVLHLAMVYPLRPLEWSRQAELPLQQRYGDVRELISHPDWLGRALRKADKLRLRLQKYVPSFSPTGAVRLSGFFFPPF